jgi:hypothetical protein
MGSATRAVPSTHFLADPAMSPAHADTASAKLHEFAAKWLGGSSARQQQIQQ